MRKAWTDLCEGVFGVPSETCFTLSEQNGNYQVDTQPSLHRHRSLSRRSLNENLQSPNTDISLDHFSMTDELQARDFASYQPSPLRKRQLLPFKARKGYANESQLPMSETLQCQGRLYTDPALTPLNRPVYIATDSHVPRQDRNLQVFFKSLPCAFVLGDFIHPTPYSSEPNSDLVHLLDVRTESDGVKLAPFLMAFLEAEVASRSLIATQGTEGSTFSSFATGTLHHAYAHDVDEEEWS